MKHGLPRFFMLDSEEIRLIDGNGRRILEKVGIKIDDPGFLNILKEAGARIDEDRRMVRFDGEWLDRVLRQAPSRFTLYSRDGLNDVHLGRGIVHFGNGGRVFRTIDPVSGQSRPTLLKDVARTAALVQSLNHLRFYIVACQAHDVKPEHYHLNDFFYALSHTTKHVMGGCDTIDGLKQMHDLVRFIAGGDDHFRKRPFVSVITNPISPLTLDPVTLETLQYCATNGIPVVCASAPISGATGPATLAGTLSQLHAEALAGVAVVQVFSPGAEVLYGAVPTSMDLRNMNYAMGSVETAMMNAGAVQLARLYNLPIYASAGVTEAKRPDFQAGMEKTFSDLAVAMAGADFIHLAAGMLDSGNSICYEQYVIDNEAIGMIQRMLSGIKTDPATLGFDTIDKVGPGGHFILEDHTVEHMMDEFYYPEFADRSNYDMWETKGRPDMLSNAKTAVEAVLKDGPTKTMDASLVGEIRDRFKEIQEIEFT